MRHPNSCLLLAAWGPDTGVWFVVKMAYRMPSVVSEISWILIKIQIWKMSWASQACLCTLLKVPRHKTVLFIFVIKIGVYSAENLELYINFKYIQDKIVRIVTFYSNSAVCWTLRTSSIWVCWTLRARSICFCWSLKSNKNLWY